ncbi:hypothetical protein TWF718_005776 [Orbilia javanica]|uniref:Uncharacterized protein n=1 Tax=Orbilia javanica TaxID=47235 RepID=A0AAN8N223_9PEZI
MSTPQLTMKGRRMTRENSSNSNNTPDSGPQITFQGTPSSFQKISLKGKQSNICGAPPPSDSRLRLINERPESVPRSYITNHRIHQFLLEEYDIPTIYFYHIVEALETALAQSPCPACFDMKLEPLARLEAKWCQEISQSLRQNIHPKVLEFLEKKFTKELGYYLFCLAQNCSDSLPEKQKSYSSLFSSSSSSSADSSSAGGGSPKSSKTAEDYIVLNNEGTQASAESSTTTEARNPMREPHITSSGGRSRAYFEIPAPRGGNGGRAPIRIFQVHDSLQLPTNNGTRNENNNNHIVGNRVRREVLVERPGQRMEHQGQRHHRYNFFADCDAWVVVTSLIAFFLGYFCDFGFHE